MKKMSDTDREFVLVMESFSWKGALISAGVLQIMDPKPVLEVITLLAIALIVLQVTWALMRTFYTLLSGDSF